VTIGASGGSGFLFIIIVAFVVLYLVVVRPQRRRQNQQQQQRLGELRVGDEVLTAGGIYGTVLEFDEDQVTVEIAPKVKVQVARRAIAGVTREDEPQESEEFQESEGTAAGPEQDVDPSGGIPPGGTSNEDDRG